MQNLDLNLLRTGLVFIHLITFAFCFSIVFFCGLKLLKMVIQKRIARSDIMMMSRLSKFMGIPMIVLCASGALFIPLYSALDPALVLNQKMHAKVIVVLVMVLNGFWFHSKSLDALRKVIRSSNANLDQLKNTWRMVLISAAISNVSWWYAFALGVFKFLNFKHSIHEYLLSYLLLIYLVVGSAIVFLWRSAQHIQFEKKY